MDISFKKEYDDIFVLLESHHNWFKYSLPLVASENITSTAVREALATDLGNRYAEGWPGERVYAGCKYIDEIELKCMELAKNLFNADFVDVRPISGVCANLSIYSEFTDPGDCIITLSIPNGGHISSGKKEFHGTAGLVHGLMVDYFAFDRDEMNIDVDKTKIKFERLLRDENKKLKLAMFGGSLFLFPHPLKELSDFFHSHDVLICYDSAHVSGLIAGGQFQDPLREGADFVTLSTHKTLFGPQGGIILSSSQYGERIKEAVFPGNTSNHHLHSVAAKAVAFAEMHQFGNDYAKQVIKNAKALAQNLVEQGIVILGEKNGFTESHQIALDITKYGDGGILEKSLEDANIITNRQIIPGDIKSGRNYKNPGGLRIGTSEITRLGMKENDMGKVAEFISRVIIKKESSLNIIKELKEFRKEFQQICYSFESKDIAYNYIRMRGS